MSMITLDEVLERIRSGTDPKELASEIGVSERTFRNRASKAGRLPEYKAVVASYRASEASKIDLDALMALADQGMSLNAACVKVGCSRTTATDRLTSENRLAEFYVRSQEARNGRTIPVVSSQEYHSGPRETLISAIPKLPPETKEAFMGAIRAVDSMISDADRLSRLCGGRA